MRKTTAVLSALALLAALTACTSSTSVAGCSPTVVSGSASKVVKATGTLGSAPKVTAPTPLYSKTTEVSTLITGKGDAITKGAPVVFDATLINGRTGAVLEKTDYTKGSGALATAGDKFSIQAISDALVCAQVGSRIAIVASPKDGHNSTASTGVKKNDSFVIVVDVTAAGVPKANGASQAADDSLPSVVLAPSGAPGITIPSSVKAPKTLTTHLLKVGSGTKVKNNEYILAQYTAVNWGIAPAVISDTWKTGAVALGLGSDAVSIGLNKALVGQRVGSQVMVVVPASQAASADGSTMTDASGQPLVYVVDILGVLAQ